MGPSHISKRSVTRAEAPRSKLVKKHKRKSSLAPCTIHCSLGVGPCFLLFFFVFFNPLLFSSENAHPIDPRVSLLVAATLAAVLK